jgi:hypothetical protein
MRHKMSEPSRRELMERTIPEYQSSSREERREILKHVVDWSGYSTKHAIALLNHGYLPPSSQPKGRSVKYDFAFRLVLIRLWGASNYLCSKRLVPFLGDLAGSLERHGHLCVSEAVRNLLSSLSASTADRLLASERSRLGRPLGTTKPGNLLRKQIAIRTHNGWDDVKPGYFEGDLVAHCGDNIRGSFLYTLVLTDICTGWTEFEPLRSRTAQSVLAGLEIIRGRLPFALLGLDTDNGTEFINELVHAYCGKDQIEFTRCRPYKKNDQAHVEQKNGSVIRRLVGYDRYDGTAAYDALRDLYSVLRLHLNHFQPSLKLASKERDAGHVTKKYEVARTPVQRLLTGNVLSDQQKEQLRSQFLAMDPVDLLCRLRTAQDSFWALAWTGAVATREDSDPGYAREYRKTPRPKTKSDQEQVDCFDPIWHEVEALLQQDQSISVSQVFRSLQSKYPAHFQDRHIALLRRKVKGWCREHPAPFIAAPIAQEHEGLQLPRRRYNGSRILTVLREEIEQARANEPTLPVKALFEQLQRLHPGRLNSQQIHMFRRRLHEWRREATGADLKPRPPADAGARCTPKQSDSQTQQSY